MGSLAGDELWRTITRGIRDAIGTWGWTVASPTRQELIEVLLDEIAQAFDEGDAFDADDALSSRDPRDGLVWTAGELLTLIRLGKDAKGVIVS